MTCAADFRAHFSDRRASAARLLLAFSVLGWLTQSAVAEDGPGVTAALTFNETDARRGQAAYSSSCARCHGDQLGGMDGPPLTGADFAAGWAGKSAADFLNRLRGTMPADSPGSLAPQQYLGLVAFLARSNGAEPGRTKMPSDDEALATMSFLPAAPGN